MSLPGLSWVFDMNSRISPRDLAYCGLFGAAALLLPVLFHLVQLGRVFMPMYLPLVALAFLVRPLPAAVTAFVTPLLSGAVTGMPPFYPPVALFMAVELSVMAALIATAVKRWPGINDWLLLIPVLLLGRALYVAMVYGASLLIDLPAGLTAGLSFLSGWPGLILIIIVVPAVSRTGNRRADGERAGKNPTMNHNPRVAFFDRIAEKWDDWQELETLDGKLAAGLEHFGVRPGEMVLDIGCGTGNLTRALLARMSDAGRVVAVDSSPRMVEQARRKVRDPRVEWRTTDAGRLLFADERFDRVICFSVWPHFDNHAAVAAELRRVMRPRAILHIWHLIPRDRVNQIHASADAAVSGDILKPGEETAKLLAGLGFTVTTVIDDGQCYLVTAVKSEA